MISMPKMHRNKKGFDLYVFVLTIVGISLLFFVAFGMMEKYYKVSNGLSIGSSQARLLKTYSDAEKALLFVDGSARLALERAAYALGKGGFYVSSPECGNSRGFTFWTRDKVESSRNCVPETVRCYPDRSMMKSSLQSFFGPSFNLFIASFNSQSEIKIPFNYEPFNLPDVAGRTEVVGVSKEPIVMNRPNIRYEVKPGFRESIPVDVIANGESVVSTAKGLAGLNEGSTRQRLDNLNMEGKFQWSLAGYSKPASSCTYDTGTECSYECGEVCDTVCEEFCPDLPTECCKPACEEYCPDPNPGTGELECCKVKQTCSANYCFGTFKRTISYDEVSSFIAAADKTKLLAPELKSFEYDFGLSWVEVTGSSDSCS